MRGGNKRPLMKQFVPGGVYDATQVAKQQQKNEQQKREQPQQQQPQQPQPQQQLQQQSQPTLQQPQQKPVEQVIEAPQDHIATTMDAEDEMVSVSNGERSGKFQFKKIFQTRKKSSVRLKEKKIRQNRQLRKAILPKNALMALNEVKGISVGDFIINSNADGGFTAVVTVNNNQYEGKGISKVAAKNHACEKALRDYILEKIKQKPRISKNSITKTNNEEAMIIGDNDSDGGDTRASFDDSDDVPMINLASFAIYKLFSEWESEGFVIPEMHPPYHSQSAASGSECGDVIMKEKKKIPIRTELPNNWELMHPATLLCMMRPGLTYKEYGIIGDKTTGMQKVGVFVDDQEFVGLGRSKKLARRDTAVKVCNALFGTQFPSEEVKTDITAEEL